jgi:YbbR domain-containing protein
VAVGVRHLARGYVADLESSEVNVTMSGPKSVVDTIRKEDVTAWVDLAGRDGRSSKRSLHVRARVSGLTENDLDLSVSPKTIDAKLEALGAKRLPVEVKFLAAPPLGYSYSDPILIPASVRISGKSTEVAKVKRVIVTLPERSGDAPIDDYFAATPIDSRGDAVGGVRLDSDKVHLKLSLVEVPATKAVLVSPLIAGEPKYPAKVTRVSVSPSSVTLEGKPSSLVGVSTVSTDRVSIDDAIATVSRDVTLRLPPGVDVVGRQSVTVTVVISASP